MKFEYKRYGTIADKVIERPVIPILIRNPRSKQSVGYEALIDSGSDHCIFSSEIAEIIGIDLATGERDDIGGVVADEKRPIYFHDIEISVGGNVRAIRAAFMPDLSTSGHGLLGQRGFFNRFSFVKFEQPKSTVELGQFL
jgi:aspartyl protease